MKLRQSCSAICKIAIVLGSVSCRRESGRLFVGHDEQYWSRQLSNGSVNEKRDALFAIASGLEGREVSKGDLPLLENLIKPVLKDSNEDVRVDAASLLMCLRVLPELAAPVLSELLLNSTNAESRFAGASQLCMIDRYDETVLQALIKGVDDKEARVRKWSVMALGHSQVKSDNVLRALRRAMLDPDKEIRLTAISQLGRVKASDTETIEILKKLQGDKDERVRKSATEHIDAAK